MVTKEEKERREKILERIEKASNENYETSWDEKGVPHSKKKSSVKKGRDSKAAGGRFELKVRHNLEEKGRVVDKWSNNLDLEEEKIIPAKRKYNPFSKALTIGTGFPDFITFKKIHKGSYSVIGVEVKMNGTLSKVEKEKCSWYLKNGIFSEIWVARMERNGRKIKVKYDNFSERYSKFMKD